MLTGQRGFDGETPLAIVTSILFDEPTPLSARLPGAPKELEDVVMRAISKRPPERFQTMAELEKAFEDLRARFDDGTLNLVTRSQARRSPMRWFPTFLDRLSLWLAPASVLH